MGYFRILAAIPGFFLSSLFVMLLWAWALSGFGLGDIDYVAAMKLNLLVWLAVAPLAAMGRKK